MIPDKNSHIIDKVIFAVNERLITDLDKAEQMLILGLSKRERDLYLYSTLNSRLVSNADGNEHFPCMDSFIESLEMFKLYLKDLKSLNLST